MLSSTLAAVASTHVRPSPLLDPWWPSTQVALASLCAGGAFLGAWLATRRRPAAVPTAPARLADDVGRSLAGVFLGALVGTFAYGTLAVVVASALDDPLVDLALTPSHPSAGLAAAQRALAADAPEVARARAELADRSGADPTDVARLTADAWAADGDCRRAWAAIERGARRAGARTGSLQLREGVVGPTLARRCPPSLDAP